MRQETTKKTIYDENGIRIDVIITVDKETPVLDEIQRREGHQYWLDHLEEELEWILNG